MTQFPLNLRMFVLSLTLTGLAVASVPGLPTDETERSPQQSSASFDRDTIAELRTEIEARVAASEDSQRSSLLLQQLDELERAERLLELQENPEPLPTLDPPYSLRDLDRTLERLSSLRAREETLEIAVRSAERVLDRATQVLDDSRRQVADGATSRDVVHTARDRVRLARFQLRNARTELATAVDEVDRLTRSAEAKRRQLAVSLDDLTERVAELDKRRAQVVEERRQLETPLDRAGSAWRSARDAGASDVQVEALRANLVSLERRAEALEGRARHLELAAEGWTSRYRLAAGELQSPAEEALAKRRLAAGLSDLAHERDLATAQMERTRAEIQRLEGARDRADEEDQIQWLDTYLAALSEKLRTEVDYAAKIETHVADHRRWLDEFSADGVAENVQVGVTAIRDRVWDVWNFEITTIDDRPITTGKLILALGLIVIGIVASRVLANQLRRRLFDRLSMDASLAANLQTLSLYFFALIFFLTAMRFVSIPLTALTFVGGALAIGIGFGSQNIVNNFISGLILMAERPIKVGDMIDVGGTYGRVERIGGRSTRVRSGDNTHVIVPNSTFLEKEVLNWTLSDTSVRTYVDVGVAYGTPAREVSKLLGRAVQDHGRILDRPAPEVLFTEFGDNALQFRVYFWIHLRQVLDRLRVQSDVRFKIAQLFREAGITIAFPQRDVHLDLNRPLDVRMVSDDDPTAAGID